MKTFKAAVFCFCALFLLYQSSSAQVTQERPQRQNQQRMMKWNDYSKPPLSDLNLTMDQRRQMDSLGNHFKSQRQTLRDNREMDSTIRRSRMNQIRMDEEQQMTRIFPEDQKTKLKAWRENQSKNRMNRPMRRDSM